MDRRIDRLTEMQIQAVINGANHFGLKRATQALCELGAPVRTTIRVLTRPAKRRNAADEDRGADYMTIYGRLLGRLKCKPSNE